MKMPLARNKLRILLVEPPASPYAWQGCAAPPLGLLYIAAALRNDSFGSTHQHDVAVLPLQLLNAGFAAALISMLQSFEPDIVGFSTPTPSYPAVLELARLTHGSDSSSLNRARWVSSND